MKLLFTVTAVIVVAAGVALLASPALVVFTLLGSSLDAPAALVVARLTGAALLSIGVAAWALRQDGHSSAGRGLVVALLLYNTAAVVLFAGARLGTGLQGLGLWPVLLVHAVMAGWCLSCLQREALWRT